MGLVYPRKAKGKTNARIGDPPAAPRPPFVERRSRLERSLHKAILIVAWTLAATGLLLIFSAIQ